jgi:transposase
VAKWVRRYREAGVAGLADRSSRPLPLRNPTPDAVIALMESMRRQRWSGLRIARETGRSRATVSRLLRRLKLSRISDLEPKLPVQRYEHERPGDLLHLDIKKLEWARC